LRIDFVEIQRKKLGDSYLKTRDFLRKNIVFLRQFLCFLIEETAFRLRFENTPKCGIEGLRQYNLEEGQWFLKRKRRAE